MSDEKWTDQIAIGNTVWYLLVCHHCGVDLVQPFKTPSERQRWANAHTLGTGHDTWSFVEERVKP